MMIFSYIFVSFSILNKYILLHYLILLTEINSIIYVLISFHLVINRVKVFVMLRKHICSESVLIEHKLLLATYYILHIIMGRNAKEKFPGVQTERVVTEL